MSEDLLVLQDVEFRYADGPFALRLADLRIAPGRHSACIGPSGSGKTTLLNLVSGILVPDAGSVHFAGIDLGRRSDAERRALRLRRIGMVFQRFELLEYLSARDNVLLPFHLAGDRRLFEEARQRVEPLAASMKIEHTLDRRPRHLSQGEQQRVAICRAMITEPDLLLCDEPTGNLDPDTSHRVLDLLFEQVRRSSATLLVVTHDHGLLDRFDQTFDVRELAERRA